MDTFIFFFNFILFVFLGGWGGGMGVSMEVILKDFISEIV